MLFGLITVLLAGVGLAFFLETDGADTPPPTEGEDPLAPPGSEVTTVPVEPAPEPDPIDPALIGLPVQGSDGGGDAPPSGPRVDEDLTGIVPDPAPQPDPAPVPEPTIAMAETPAEAAPDAPDEEVPASAFAALLAALNAMPADETATDGEAEPFASEDAEADAEAAADTDIAAAAAGPTTETFLGTSSEPALIRGFDPAQDDQIAITLDPSDMGPLPDSVLFEVTRQVAEDESGVDILINGAAYARLDGVTTLEGWDVIVNRG